jgi:hypothetical protein
VSGQTEQRPAATLSRSTGSAPVAADGGLASVDAEERAGGVVRVAGGEPTMAASPSTDPAVPTPSPSVSTESAPSAVPAASAPAAISPTEAATSPGDLAVSSPAAPASDTPVPNPTSGFGSTASNGGRPTSRTDPHANPADGANGSGAAMGSGSVQANGSSSADRSVRARSSASGGAASNGWPPADRASGRGPRPARGGPTGGGPARGATADAGPAHRTVGPHPTEVGRLRAPGGMIAERYRLLIQVGADTSVHAEFWRARDTVLERDVALTLLQDTGERGGTERADDMIRRALRSGRFEHIGCARLLDVMRNDWKEPGGLPADVHGLAVTEWVPGKSLAEAVAGGPLRTGVVLGMLDPLAQAAEAAHRQGLVLGCAHPQRVRITPEGGARLAFALPNPAMTPADDVRGLGATLYALLTGTWPLSGTDAELAGMPPTPRDVQGSVLPPGVVRPGVSVEVSALTLGALGAGGVHGQVHTAAAVHKVTRELLDSEAEAALLPPPDDGAPVDPDEVWRTDSVGAPKPDRERKRKLSIGMGGLGLGMLAVIGYVGVQAGSLLGVTPASPPKIVVASPPPAAASVPAAPLPPLAPPPAVPPPAPGLPAAPPDSAAVPVASARVFDLSGDPDNQGRVSKAVDNNPATSWSTYLYHQPFPALKPGVGIMVSFASPVQLSSLAITSPSNGSQLEIRSAPAPDAQFNQTVPIGNTTLAGPVTTVALAGSQPVQNVLVWITKLGGGDDQNVTEIAELHFQRAVG